MDANDEKLRKFMKNTSVSFYIPPYQRNYKWNIRQAEVFLRDILNTFNSYERNESTGHFIGAITYFIKNLKSCNRLERYVLIDGQQRIITASLFVLAARNAVNDDKDRNILDRDYLKNDYIYDDYEIKLQLKHADSDWDVYKKLVYDNTDELTEKDKQTNLYKNYNYFFKYLSYLQEEGISLYELVENGLMEWSYVDVQIETHNKWEDPQEIFESMNSLGEPLTLADLVRNYMFLSLPEDKQDKYYRTCWCNIETTLTPEIISPFIRDYMQAKLSKHVKSATVSNYKELYYIFKQNFGNDDSEIEYDVENSCMVKRMKDMREFATYYAMIVLGNKTGNDVIDGLLNDIRHLNIKGVYSSLLVILHERSCGDFSDSDTIEIIKALRIYFLRRRLMSVTAGESITLPTLAEKIPNLKNEADKTAGMFRIICSLSNSMKLPNDKDIRKYLADADFYKSDYCRFFLSIIEETLTKNRPECWHTTELQIEHIMPQTLNDEWRQYLGSDCDRIHQEYVNDIGNLTIVRHNQELGRKSFDDKKEIYDKKAGLQIARTKIIDCNIWDENAIKIRHEWLVDILLDKVLPVPEEMRNGNNYADVQDKQNNSIDTWVNLRDYDIDTGANGIFVRGKKIKEYKYEGTVHPVKSLTHAFEELVSILYEQDPSKFVGEGFSKWLNTDKKMIHPPKTNPDAVKKLKCGVYCNTCKNSENKIYLLKKMIEVLGIPSDIIELHIC